MKTVKILSLTGMMLMAFCLAAPVKAGEGVAKDVAKKTISINLEKPIIDYIASACEKPLDAKDIIRMQKVLDQVDHVTISFTDQEAADYQLSFDELDAEAMERWMFEQGYSVTAASNEISVPWMEKMDFGAEQIMEAEVSVPWMETMVFGPTETWITDEVSVPWMDNLKFVL